MSAVLEQLRESRKDIKGYLRGDYSEVAVSTVAIPPDVDVEV